MKKLKTFSYNIHKGYSTGNKKFTLELMRKEIRALRPDLIFLQEIHGNLTAPKKKSQHWPHTTQFEYLAEDMWPHFSYGINAFHSKGDHGNAILCKYPILSSVNFDVSTNRWEKRGFLHVVVKLPGPNSKLHAICTHLGLLAVSRRKQLKTLFQYINHVVPADAPLLVAGDFNDWSRYTTAKFKTELGLREAFLEVQEDCEKTFPSISPFLCLDRIYFRNIEMKAVNKLPHKKWRVLSDHLPLCVDFAFPGANG